MNYDETKKLIQEDVERYAGYVAADMRDLERAKLTLANNQRLLKLTEKHLAELEKNAPPA